MPSDETRPIPGPEPTPALARQDQRTLFQVAQRSIAGYLSTGRELDLEASEYPLPLREHRATFVTLRIASKLRGCMGSLIAREPLVRDVAHNAASAAFRDPRFPPLNVAELPQLDIHLSLLSVPEPLEVSSEQEFLARIRVGIDGLILHEGNLRSTLLPAVWETISDPRKFLATLKQKAGLPVDYWSDSIRFERYLAESLAPPDD